MGSLARTVASPVYGTGRDSLLDCLMTPPSAARALLAVERFAGAGIEPCSGTGNISRVLEGWPGVASVLSADRSTASWVYGERGVDALTDRRTGDFAMTNPPFVIAEAVIRASLARAPKVAMLLRLGFLESRRRASLWREFPPVAVYVLTGRIHFHIPGDAGPGLSSIQTAWYVWQRGYTGESALRWIDYAAPRGEQQRKGETPHD